MTDPEAVAGNVARGVVDAYEAEWVNKLYTDLTMRKLALGTAGAEALRQAIYATVLPALRSSREEALEEAATLADRECVNWHPATPCVKIGEAIRKLKEPRG